MPAALYAMTLRQGGPLGNPFLVTHQGAVQTSRHYWSHFLCGECEEHLNRNGERYAMTQVDNGQGRFPLLESLQPFASDVSLQHQRHIDEGLSFLEN